MNERINEKIKEIEGFINEIEEFTPSSLDEYLKDSKSKAACERVAEKIIEALVDLAFLVIKDKGFKIPEDDESSFEILHNERAITEDLAIKLRNAKGMRNILAHEYGEVDDEIVFKAISDELVNDAKEFIEELRLK